VKVGHEYLTSNQLQFRFKTGTGCAEATYTVRTAIDYLNTSGRVFAASLDISKSYDKDNHCTLFSVLGLISFVLGPVEVGGLTSLIRPHPSNSYATRSISGGMPIHTEWPKIWHNYFVRLNFTKY